MAASCHAEWDSFAQHAPLGVAYRLEKKLSASLPDAMWSMNRCQWNSHAPVSCHSRALAKAFQKLGSYSARFSDMLCWQWPHTVIGPPISREKAMRPLLTVALSIFAGVGFGAAAVQALHAQAKPPAYVVAEIDVTNAEPYEREYVPPAAKAIRDAGGKYVVRGGDTVAIFGEPPKPRIAVMVCESMEKAKAAFDSLAYKDAKKVGDKYAKFRVYAVDGLLQ